MFKKWVESPRGRTYYWMLPKPGAPMLVFLHGLGADHTLFERQAEYFRDQYALLAWDAPGQGASRPYREPTLLHQAVELKRILDQESILRCILVGQSMGGMLAQVFIDHWPERVRAFVGIGTCPMDRCYYSKSDLKWLSRAGSLSKLFPFRLLHYCVAHCTSRSFYGRANMRAALEVYDRRALQCLMGDAYATLVREMDSVRLNCPALLLVGEKDRVGKVRSLCAVWHVRAGIPLYRVRAAGHNANADNPRSANRLMHAFFNSLPPEIR